VDSRRAAEIQVVLEGIPLPASRAELARYAGAYDGDAAAAIERIPDRSYASIDEVGEALFPTQPRRQDEPRLPRPESGEPPGGAAYVDPASGNGTRERESQTQKRPQAARSA
jgi:uncharacterized protein DUF2795